MSRKCPWHGCDVRVPSSFFCCKKHWDLLTMKEKDALIDAHAAHRDNHIEAGELKRRQQHVLGTRGTV